MRLKDLASKETSNEGNPFAGDEEDVEVQLRSGDPDRYPGGMESYQLYNYDFNREDKIYIFDSKCKNSREVYKGNEPKYGTNGKFI